MFVDDLELLEINHKNRLYGWANKNGKALEFETLEEKIEGGRRLFRVGAMVNGELLAEGKAFNKKDASQIEINPLVETVEGDIIALDAKINFDDNALHRHDDIKSLRDLDEEEALEIEASKYELNYKIIF